MSKQTAVEWIKKQLDFLEDDMGDDGVKWLFSKAKAMEKEQIVDACNSQRNDYRGMPTYNKSGEQYYNETYGGDQ